LQNLTRLQTEADNILSTQFEHSYEYIPNAEQCFDAIWAFTLALNRTMQGNCHVIRCMYGLRYAQTCTVEGLRTIKAVTDLI